VKQLADTADDCVKHVEELTWQLDDDSSRRTSTVQSPTTDGVRSQKVSKSLPPDGSDSFRMTKIDQKLKGMPIRSKSHISDDSPLQRHRGESKSVLSSTKKLKLDSVPDKTANLEKKQRIASNMSVSFSGSDVDRLLTDKRARPAQAEVKSDKKPDFSKSKVLSDGDQEEIGVVSFVDEVEPYDSFLSCQTPLLHAEQGAVYSDFESAVLDEYVDREPARRSSGRRTDHDSSDDDVFDLIASGRINKVMRQPWKSLSNYDRLQPVAARHTDRLSASAGVGHKPVPSKHQLADSNVDHYDSASSADTDVVIRSHRLMSEVATDVQNRSFSSSPNVALDITRRNCNDNGREQLANVSEVASPSQSLAKDRCVTELGRKKKRTTGQSSETAVKTGAVNPAVQKFASIVSENSQTKGLQENGCSTALKRKRKHSEVDDSEVTSKNDAVNADSSAVQTTKFMLLSRNVDDVDSSHIKQRKTDVSL